MVFRSRRIRGFSIGAALAAVALVAAACGASPGGGVTEGGVFRLGSASSIDSLNPFVAFQEDAYSTFEIIYPYLVQYNSSLQFVPDFARSWSAGGGGRVWTFHTQPGARWSDGKPLTAADAAWTYRTILKFQGGPAANAAGDVAHMKSATAPNATTLVLTYRQPVANVLSQLQQVPILPEHVWARYAAGNGKALTTFTNPAPIVSGGPFTLVKYTPKQIVLFKRNDHGIASAAPVSAASTRGPAKRGRSRLPGRTRRGPGRPGGGRGIVQVARPAVGRAGRVVAGRPAQRVGQPRPGADQVGSGASAASTAPRIAAQLPGPTSVIVS